MLPVLLGALLVSGSVASPAQADDLSDARSQATAAAERVEALEARIGKAQAAYEAAKNQR